MSLRYFSLILIGIVLVLLPQAFAQLIPTTFFKNRFEIISTLSGAGVFNGSASLSKTPALGNRRKFTFSSWVRTSDRSKMLFSSGANGSDQTFIWLGGSGPKIFFQHSVGAVAYQMDALFTDNVWFHFVMIVDSEEAVSVDRVKFYFNGVRVPTIESATMAQNTNTYFGANVAHRVGGKAIDGSFGFIGRLEETYYINGHALDAGYFVRRDGSGLRSVKYLGPVNAQSFYLRYVSGSVGVNSMSGGMGNLTNTSVTSDTNLPY